MIYLNSIISLRRIEPSLIQHLLAFIGFLAANVLSGLVFLLYRSPGSPSSWNLLPNNDAWNNLVYARNFAQTLTFSYNPGVPEAGMTSPLWVVLLGVLSWPASAFGLDFPALSQVTAILVGAGVSIFAYLIVVRISGMAWAGILAGLAIALDPTLAFAKVSGSEVALFSMLSLGVVWALLIRKTTLASVLMALTVLARPEGILVAGVALLVVVLTKLWHKETLEHFSTDSAQELILLIAPALLVGAGWAVYNWSVSGLPLPNAFYVNAQAFILYDKANLVAIWNGYLRETTYLGGFQAIVSIGAMAAGGYYALRRVGGHALALILIPLLLIYTISTLIPFPNTPWNIAQRQYLDATLPYIVILIVLGIAMGWEASAKYVQSQTRMELEWRSQLWTTLAAGVLILAVIPMSGAPARWLKLVPEYSSNVRNIAEAYLPISHWMDRNLPPDAKVAAMESSALRYFSNREIVDLSGLNNHQVIGQRVLKSALKLEMEYLVAFDNLYMRSWPFGKELASVQTNGDSILSGTRLVVYHIRPTPDVLTNDTLTNVSLDGFRLIDSLDIGDTEDEVRHGWEANPLSDTLTRTFRTNEDFAIEDDARITTGYEEFRVASVPDTDLIIVKRYDSAVRGAVRVFVNGRQVGVWRFPPKEYFFGEDQFVVPGSFMTGDTALLRFEHIPDSKGQTNLNSFYYWIFAPDVSKQAES